MGIIKQLPQNVANQISAGEVVERPASIVKELIENSIDAEANKIEVNISEGGREKIHVKDNGTGILPEDMEMAFCRYATSKIKNIDDIYSLFTLGFRGEALSSISSVAKIKMISRHKSKESGMEIKIIGGKIESKKPVGCQIGTEITVRDIFYNTPARYKYLKTTSTEFGHISKIVSAEAAAYPEIQFKLNHNKNNVLTTPGNGKLEDTIFAIYGEEIANNLIEVNIEDRYIKLNGYIGNTNISRASRSHELFFVNKRPILNRTATSAVEKAYKRLLDPGRYPVVFLFIDVNPILVDVNVHPAKKEVKFSRNQIIFDVISKGLRKILKNENPTPIVNVNKNNTNKNNSQPKISPEKIQQSFDQNTFLSTVNNKQLNNKNSIHDRYSSYQNKQYTNYISKKNIKNNPPYKKQVNYEDNYEYSKEHYVSEENIKFKYLGQIFNSYLTIETETGIKIIDQHNAHERILFENLFAEYNSKNNTNQALLLPVKIDLSPEEKEIVNKYKESLNKLGIVFSDFGGNTILIEEVPSLLKDKSTRNIIENLIGNLLKEGKTLNIAEQKEVMIKYLACRSAIKAGRPLNKNESIKLIKDLLTTENPYRCPHSRPIMIEISKKEIERGLGR
ncbi:DNA mismatch repair endonuclease MutL [Halanaerobium sp. MA284_MarDTE_T2]|uniref:DNA mismatch repair endonuclease MutL n=1 Tax=Halanaerobium sp. MA284_MarDTE_T2 TaxID=2183913 RepID=UPI000DF4C095|nr:DNA mismatch repair endonuclease MutL [Halanaerobium sp. MA284_MarDTE_T2]RCW51492.1 DNA mismatch repair protein MutL [Halanaerobium sp. MA284_MarDTE_T2]